jgi:hypothetical protein
MRNEIGWLLSIIITIFVTAYICTTKTEKPIITTYGEKKCHIEDISKEVRDADCRTEFNCKFP